MNGGFTHKQLVFRVTGVHPFDCNGDLTDAELVDAIKTIKRPPLEGSALTAHLSPSAIDLLAKLMSIDPTHRLSAHEMLEHPWVLGKTAKQDIIAGSDQRLSRFRRFRSRIAAKVFRDLVNWSDGGRDDERDYEQEHPPDRGKSLMEKAFTNLDKEKKGFITLKDVAAAGLVDEDDETYSTASESSIKAADGNKEDETQSSLSLSGFSELVGENLQSKFFPVSNLKNMFLFASCVPTKFSFAYSSWFIGNVVMATARTRRVSRRRIR